MNAQGPFGNSSLALINEGQRSSLKLIFLVLSFMSSFLELGPIILLITNQANLQSVLFMGFCYQIGNLAASSIPLKRTHVIFTLGCAVIASLLFTIQTPGLLYLSVGLTSLALQKTRRYVVAINPHKATSTLLKRSVRVVGFLLSAFISGASFRAAIILVFGIAVFVAVRYKESWLAHPQLHSPKRNIFAGIMVIHQSHYFSYAYLIPVLMLSTLNIPVMLSGLAFITGWLSYISSEALFGKFNLRKTFIMGHLVVFVSLVAIGLFASIMWVVLLAWFISGIGGGTVFCLTRMNRQSEYKVDMEFWEDIGHVLGVLLTLTLVLMFDEILVSHLFFFSAVVALSAAFAMVRWGKTA